MRIFNYNSNNGPGGATNVVTMGEYYMPRIAAVGCYFYMSSLIQSGSTMMHVYIQPQLVLYNPYNVTLVSPPNQAYSWNINSNLWGVPITVAIGNQTPFNGAPLGSMCGGVNFTTGTNANLVFRPGELKIFGAGSGVMTGTTGSLTAYPLVNDPSGYVSGFLPVCTSSSQSTLAWSSTTTQLADPVSVSCGGSGFGSNNGTLNVTVPGGLLWPNKTSGGNTFGRFFANNTSESATTVQLGTVGSLQSTNNAPILQFAQFVLRLKGVDQSQTSTGALSQMPVFANSDGLLGPLAHVIDNGSFDIDFAVTQNAQNSQTEISQTGSPPDVYTTWGSHDVGIYAADPVGLILHDIPRQPMTSLGQFMHMTMRNSMAPGSTGGNHLVDETNCMYPVGGSLCDPFVVMMANLSGTCAQMNYQNNLGPCVIDDNFVMNQALFDSYFFSTVPPSADWADASYKACFPAYFSGTTAFNATNIANRTVTMPNSRMQIYWKNNIPPVTTGTLQQYNTAAAGLMLNGAFNVNSTSVPAWQALLGSLSGDSANYLLPSGGGFGSISPSQLANPIFRFLSAVSIDGSNTVNSPWGGIHSLSNTQTQTLAQAIVNQVKLRGPFLSMADFLNRRLDPNTNPASGLGFKGALQAAIDSTNINAAIANALPLITSSNSVRIARINPYNVYIPIPANTIPSTTSFGVPGWLIQQDIVQSFAPMMTVRSDTFVIRCYGEADNQATGLTEGRAWCEAVVQRCPDFIDQTDTALQQAGDATPLSNVNITNQTFGRKFKIISFRWLNETDL